jgi:hypothetical protein
MIQVFLSGHNFAYITALVDNLCFSNVILRRGFYGALS